MTSLYISPLTFNCKKNEIALNLKTIEWKKQIATISKKKDLSAIEYLEQKYGDKIGKLFNDVLASSAVVFAYFDYDNDTTIYLMYIPDSNDTKSIETELIFDSYIPSINLVEIVDGSYDIECCDDKIIVRGQVYGLCVCNETYYFKPINIDQYIEYVQRNNDGQNDEEVDEEAEAEDIEEGESDTDELDDEDELCNSDNELDDDELDNDDDDDDELDDDLKDDSSIKDIADDAEVDADADVDGDDAEDAEDVDDAEEADEDEAEEQTAVEDDEEGGEGGGDGDDDFVDFEPEIEKVVKTKKPKLSKSVQLNSNIDFSIILNILKEESKTVITSELQLHPKRKLNIQILKTLKLPIKTIQMIEKGIYNYAINKCNYREFIPIWDNSEFLEIYVSKSKHIYSNLNTKTYVKNLKLIDKIKNGLILPYDLAFMDTYKLYPEMWSSIIDEKIKIDRMLKESLQECKTDLFECPMCHKHETIYLQIQVRSSDEPMTNFITCINCGYKWQLE